MSKRDKRVKKNSRRGKGQKERGVGGGREEGAPGWSSNLNPVFKCLHMSEFSLDRTAKQSLTAQRFSPLRKPPMQSQLSANHLLPFSSVSSFLTISESDCGKQGGDGRGKVWHLFLTQHMCVYLKIVWRANWGLFLLMRARRRHTPDSPECEQMPGSGGGWIVGCDSHSVCLHCLRLHKGLLRTWSFHNSAYNVADKLVVGFIVC